MSARIWWIVLAVALAACAPEPEAPRQQAAAEAEPALAPAATPAPAETPAEPVEELGPAPGAPAEAPAETAGRVILQGDGVAMADGGVLAFGTPTDAAIEQLTAAFEVAPSNRDTLDDCGPGPLDFASWDNGFSAYFHDGGFAGWSAVDQRTAEGIGFGSSRAELDAAYAPEVSEGSLGFEFFVNGYSGVLESMDDDAHISDFWAGMTCVMR